MMIYIYILPKVRVRSSRTLASSRAPTSSPKLPRAPPNSPELPQAFALPWPFENIAPADKSEKTALQDHPRPHKTTEITDISEINRKHCTCRQIQDNGSPRSLLGLGKHCTCRQTRETGLQSHWALKSATAEPLGV